MWAQAVQRAGPVPRGLGTSPGWVGGSNRGRCLRESAFLPSASVVRAGTQEPEENTVLSVCAPAREPYCFVHGSSLLKKPDVHVYHSILDFDLLQCSGERVLVQPASAAQRRERGCAAGGALVLARAEPVGYRERFTRSRPRYLMVSAGEIRFGKRAFNAFSPPAEGEHILPTRMSTSPQGGPFSPDHGCWRPGRRHVPCGGVKLPSRGTCSSGGCSQPPRPGSQTHRGDPLWA